MGGGGAQCSVWPVNEPKKDGCAQRTGAHAQPKPTSLLSYIYLSVCLWFTIAERSAILLVLVIKLTKEMRWWVWRGRDRDGEIGEEQNMEGGCEETLIWS